MDDRLGRRSFARRRAAAALMAAGLTVCTAATGTGQTAGAHTDADADRLTQYEDAVDAILPLTPRLIMDFNERVRAARGASQWRPEPVRRSTDADLVSLEPGTMSPALRLAPGVATVVTFSDATGQPWPVVSWVVGDQASFDIHHSGGVDGQQGPSHLTLAPLVEAGWSNLVVELAGQPIPVILSLAIDPAHPHYRLDLQILALGPNAAEFSPSGVATAPRAGSPELMKFIAAVDLPDGATETAVDNVDGTRVWLTGKDGGHSGIVVRTPHSLIGPAWSEVMSGPGGIRVYRLPLVNSLLFSVGGGTVIARVAVP